MKNRRKKFCHFLQIQMTLICSAVFLSFQCPAASITASAHSGRTDANGGHRDNKNKSGLGYYHYHHGYSAHLHPNGICPYDTSQASLPKDNGSSQASDNILPSAPETTDPVLMENVLPANISAKANAAEIDYSYVFDAGFYAAFNPDVTAVFGTEPASLLQHFITAGMAEGRQGNAIFNVFSYKASNPQLAALFGEDLTQYYLYYCSTHAGSAD